jgi:PA14 domain
MKQLLTFLFLLIFSITYSQSGVGYLNYTVYNIANNGAGAYANNATDFTNMFDVTKGAVVYASGTAFCNSALLDFNGRWTASGLPNGGNYTGIKIYGYFVPKETGTYSFFINGDDGVDFSLDGNVVTSFYGAHGFGANHYGTVSLIAGKSYAFMARYQNWGGGWGMDLEWKRPSQSNWSIQSDEVTTTNFTPTKKAIANFNFNTSISPTTFSISSTLSSAGSIDITTSLDSTKISNGYNGKITSGQVEWSYVNFFNGVTTLYIDMRQFGNTTPSSVNSISILDVYSGPVTFRTSDGTWAQYTVPSTLAKVLDGSSLYNSSIRNAGYNNYAFSCNVSFSSNMVYKTQSITLSTTNNLATLYNSIVTVSDVYMAFQEYSNQGLFGNQNGSSFTYGIQYQNGDINNDGIFNEADCFALLQNLTGTKTLVDTFNLNKTVRLIPQTRYDSIGKSNWNTFINPLSSTYSFDINTGKSTDSLNLSVAWKGDVNLSHSTTPKSNNLTTMSVKTMGVSNEIQSTIMSELIGDSVIVTITLNPSLQQVVGTQFMINYDNSLLKFSTVKFTTNGNPSNFGTDKGTYINVGSLVTDGTTTLDSKTSYKISFKTLTKLNNVFGLISVSGTDAVNQNGTQLKIKLI